MWGNLKKAFPFFNGFVLKALGMIFFLPSGIDMDALVSKQRPKYQIVEQISPLEMSLLLKNTMCTMQLSDFLGLQRCKTTWSL